MVANIGGSELAPTCPTVRSMYRFSLARLYNSHVYVGTARAWRLTTQALYSLLTWLMYRVHAAVTQLLLPLSLDSSDCAARYED